LAQVFVRLAFLAAAPIKTARRWETTETSSDVAAGPAGSFALRCAVLGIAALSVGVCIYVAARDIGTAYLLPESLTWPMVESGLGSLPTFFHVVAFSMLTIAAVNPRSTSTCVAIALGWCAMNMVFEIGQHSTVAPIVTSMVPASFDVVPLLDNLAPYFQNGIFDFADLLAAAIGAIVSVGLVLWLRNKEIES
jgi:hypothetical protein